MRIDRMSREAKKVERLFNDLSEAPLKTFPDFGGSLEGPDRQGVYVIYSPHGKVLHVGRTPSAKGGIAQRLHNHMSGSSSFTRNYLKGKGSQLRGKYKYRCLVVDDPRLRTLLEAYTAGHLCPDHLGVG